MNTRPERGIVLTTAELASEGVDAVMDAIAGAGANAITTTTAIVAEAGGESDLREPPLDVAGGARQLERPLWGKRTVWVERYVAHPPDPELWRDLPWAPPPLAPEAIRVDRARQAIDAARARDMRVYAHFAPYALPGGGGGLEGMPSYDELRHEFRPTRFIGGVHPDGIAYIGCLNNPVVRRYGRARLRELLRHYGDVDGLALDWVEYPVYFIDKLFTCFCPHCQRQAAESGFDWEQMRASVRVLWDSLHTVTPEEVRNLIRSGDWGDVVADPAAMLDGFTAWLDFKSESVSLAIDDLRAVMAEAGAGEMLLATSEFALPWGRMTGSAYASTARGVTSQRIKLYSFHWLMMVRWWTDTILSWNRGSAVTPEEITRGMLALFALSLKDAPEKVAPDQFGMPAPDESHNLTPESYTWRLDNALEFREDQAPVLPLLHAYRPAAEFGELLEALRPNSQDGLWINRYGYLGDAKLAMLREAWTRD